MLRREAAAYWMPAGACHRAAPRADPLAGMTEETCDHILAARFASESCILLSLFENRGRREGRVPAAPAAPCARIARKAHTGITTGKAESHRPSLRDGLRLTSSSCVCKICQNVRTGGSDQPPVAGSEPVRAQRPQEPDGERGTDPVSSSTRTVAWALSPNRARKGAG